MANKCEIADLQTPSYAASTGVYGPFGLYKLASTKIG